MEKKLEIEMHPIAKSYQYIGYAMSIIQQHPNFEEWLVDNYIQLSFDEDNINKGVIIEFLGGTIFDSVELLDYVDSISEKKNYYMNDLHIIEYIINCIDNEKYVYTMLNEFYVPYRECYQNSEFEHDCLIIGYSKEREILYLIGYDEYRQYIESEIKFNEFCKAFRTADLVLKEIKMNKKGYEGSLEKFFCRIRDYLYSYDCRKNLQNYIDDSNEKAFFSVKYAVHGKIYFGINTYGKILEYLQQVVEQKYELDIRALYILYEHKKCMYKRLGIIQGRIEFNILDIISTYEKLVEETKIIVNLGIKYILSNKLECISSIMGRIKECEMKEVENLKELLVRGDKNRMGLSIKMCNS